MEKIKFKTTKYLKFKNIACGKPWKLIQIFQVHKKELSKEFLFYDTVYKDLDSITGLSEYEFQNSEMMVLLFLDYQGNLVTTIRRRFKNDIDQFVEASKKIGKMFEVVFE